VRDISCYAEEKECSSTLIKKIVCFESINKSRVHHHETEAGANPLFEKNKKFFLPLDSKHCLF
jgi:hypothetical protein